MVQIYDVTRDLTHDMTDIVTHSLRANSYLYIYTHYIYDVNRDMTLDYSYCDSLAARKFIYIYIDTLYMTWLVTWLMAWLMLWLIRCARIRNDVYTHTIIWRDSWHDSWHDWYCDSFAAREFIYICTHTIYMNTGFGCASAASKVKWGLYQPYSNVWRDP